MLGSPGKTWANGETITRVWVYGHTTVDRCWLAERLGMGYETRISQAGAQVVRGRQPGDVDNGEAAA